MLRELIMDCQIIECPKCHTLGRVLEVSSWLNEERYEGNAICYDCTCSGYFDPTRNDERDQLVRNPLDFTFQCVSLNVTTVGWGYHWSYTIQDPKKPEDEEVNMMNTVWVARHKDAKSLILGIFTDDSAAYSEYIHLKQVELVAFPCQHTSTLGESFPVWVVSVGKDTAYRIINIFSDEKQAFKIASSIGGKVVETEAIPNRRRRRNIHVSKSFVVLGDVPERHHFCDELRVRRKLFSGEETKVFPMATFRRAYDRSLPHRIEVLALNESVSRDAARDLSTLTDTTICSILEYNVDYKLVQTDGKWSIDPCLLDQPV